MNRTRIYLIGAIILLVLATVVVLRILSDDATTEQRHAALTLVEVQKPTRDTLTDMRTYTGDIVAIQQANIFSKVSGTLERVTVNMGTPVRAGELLAQIDTTELHEALMQTAATYENARIMYNRTRDLFSRTLASQQDLDNAETAMNVAAATFQTAQTRLNYALITAPFSGIVTRRYLDPGVAVTANNATLFTLMDLNVVKVFVSVLENDIPSIKTGQQARVTVDAFPGRIFKGTVTRYSQSVDLGTRTMPVEIDIPNRGHLLKPGMFGTVTLILSERPNVITVPTQAILKSAEGFLVFTVRGDTARSIRVAPGIEQNSRTEIRSGLNGDEPIIVTGQQFVKDGGPVKVQR